MDKVNSLVELNTQIRQKKDVIVLVSQNDCVKCEILKGVIPAFEQEGDITKPVLTINLDDEGVDREKAIKLFDMMSTPVLLGYKGGELKQKYEGDVTPKQLYGLEEL